MEVITAVGLSLIGSGGGVLIASPLLFLTQSVRTAVVPTLISYAVGALLGVALLALVPEALQVLSPPAALGSLLSGVLGFFTLEKLVIWRHCHTMDCEAHDSSATLILIGGAVHNFTDGMIIGAATLTALPLGITTALAVAAHQIPQEVSDYAVLLDAGYTRSRAFLLNTLSASTSALGAIAVSLASGWTPYALPYVLAVAAGSFLYVAMSDLIPGLHRNPADVGAIRQVMLIVAGIVTILVL